ncbi:3'(2'),5'-bisphosphate nucleotidase CysQ [Gordonia sp. CPCC 205515]|uniref:3'(2'),5'-bisphosphate nucleotidase CysQ n=1 Tax=Gordonia sp. CPCC 205515 TaxID=3140791 RepID=UPI003AF39203
MSTHDSAADRILAGELATAAGELLLDVRATSGLAGKELGNAGDQRSNDFILARLAEERPDDAVLSEESTDDKSRLTAERVWIIDPVDGTREYGTDGHADWAVHVALWSAADGLIVGAVALPALGVTYVDSPEPVTPVDGLAAGPKGDRPRVVVSASRPPEFSQAVADAIGGEVLQMGSAGAKAMAVVRGEADAYVHAGGQYEWDSAAPVAVTQAKGLWCGRIDGSELVYNRDNTYMPDLVICRPEIRDAVIGVTAAYA